MMHEDFSSMHPLIYADYLEERGSSQRSELVRLRHELKGARGKRRLQLTTRLRELTKSLWVTSDGRELFVSEMTDRHLINAERFMRARGNTSFNVYKHMVMELKSRRLSDG